MTLSQLDPHTRAVPQQAESTPPAESAPRPIAPRTAAIGGLLWMVAGPMTLFMSTIALVLKAERFWTSADGFYAAGLAAMFLGRWLEWRSGVAETEDGRPLTRRDVYRYYLLTGFGGVAVWLIALGIRTLWLSH